MRLLIWINLGEGSSLVTPGCAIQNKTLGISEKRHGKLGRDVKRPNRNQSITITSWFEPVAPDEDEDQFIRPSQIINKYRYCRSA